MGVFHLKLQLTCNDKLQLRGGYPSQPPIFLKFYTNCFLAQWNILILGRKNLLEMSGV